MSNTEIISLIIEMTRDSLEFMLPIIAVLSAIHFLLSFLIHVTMGWSKRTFGG